MALNQGSKTNHNAHVMRDHQNKTGSMTAETEINKHECTMDHIQGTLGRTYRDKTKMNTGGDKLGARNTNN